VCKNGDWLGRLEEIRRLAVKWKTTCRERSAESEERVRERESEAQGSTYVHSNLAVLHYRIAILVSSQLKTKFPRAGAGGGTSRVRLLPSSLVNKAKKENRREAASTQCQHPSAERALEIVRLRCDGADRVQGVGAGLGRAGSRVPAHTKPQRASEREGQGGATRRAESTRSGHREPSPDVGGGGGSWATRAHAPCPRMTAPTPGTAGRVAL
jgi:hypothetical protein